MRIDQHRPGRPGESPQREDGEREQDELDPARDDHGGDRARRRADRRRPAVRILARGAGLVLEGALVARLVHRTPGLDGLRIGLALGFRRVRHSRSGPSTHTVIMSVAGIEL